MFSSKVILAYDFEQFTIDAAKWSDCDRYAVLFAIDQMHNIHLVFQRQIVPLSTVKNVSKTIILKQNFTM